MALIKKTDKIRIDLRKFFTREAKRNIIGNPNTSFPTYKSLLNKRMGIKLDSAPDNDEKYSKLKGKNHWLVRTGETMNKGFQFKVGKRDLLIFASKKTHSGKGFRMTKSRGRVNTKAKNPPTYEKIFQWHNKKNYSGVFGQLPIGSKFPKRLIAEVGKQILPNITKGIKRVYKV